MQHPATSEYYADMSKQEKFALWVTDRIGTVECAIIFAGIGIGSLVGIITNNTLLALIFGSFSSYFLQLVLLPLIMVSQNLQQRHAELLASKDYEADKRAEQDIVRLVNKLDTLLQRKHE